MEYKKNTLGPVKRNKVALVSFIAAVIFHVLLFFSFRVKFVPYMEVAIPKMIRVKRVNIPPGNRPGPLSASSARKEGPPKPVNKTMEKPVPIKKEFVKVKPQLNSSLKVPTKRKEEENKPITDNQEIMLDQKAGEYDVLSMVEGGAVIPGGGNMGNDPNAYGLTYDENTVFEYAEEAKKNQKDEKVASAPPVEKFLGTLATPIVTSEPRTEIMETFTKIPYPDSVKIKKANLREGVCRVFLRLSIDRSGEITDIYIRSPKTDEDKEKYKIFLDAVTDTVKTWDFEPKLATVFVDVRFDIE